ncbi:MULTISPECIES: DUF4880 domain-containing protein [unclassified Sphingomonas]|nr:MULTISPECIES: DUF4880 domain-containing protein [unclassified Sphingomonas]
MNEQQQRRERIEEEAADWLAALDCGRADPAAFEAWRAADPAHAIAFIRISQAWRQLDRLPRNPAPPQEEAIEAPDEDAPAMPTRRRALAAAGLAGLAVTGGTIFAVQSAAAQVVETAVGERRRFYVDEKACFDLNTASRLRWWRGDDGIEVELERGQLSLDLAPGSPSCTVRAGPGAVRFGTGMFDLRLVSRDVADVVAIRGEARLLPRHGERGEIRLARRQGLTISAAAAPRPRPIADDTIRALSAWREGELIFAGQTLAEAVAEYNRYLRTPIVLADPAAGRLRLGGRFLTSDPTEFLEAVHANFGLRAEPRPDQILLHR